jgi:hypothetical protein
VSSWGSDACVANAAVVEKSLNLPLRVRLGSKDTNDQSRCEPLVNQEKYSNTQSKWSDVAVPGVVVGFFSAPLVDVVLALRA